MFHILGFLFIIIIAILIIGLSIVGTVIRSVFGLKKRGSSSRPNGNGSYNGGGYSYNSGNNQSNSSSQNRSAEPDDSDNHSKRKKLFSKDEGEYVDFEEVKE